MAATSNIQDPVTPFKIPIRTSPAGAGDLPLELHQQILSYLPWRDQLNCEHVCKAWREDLRGRISKPRATVAPWLPQQDFDISFYDVLTVHTLVTNGKAFAFKCREGFRLFDGANVVPDSVFRELGGNLSDMPVEAIPCIYSFKFIEKTSKGKDAKFIELPVANLSFLDDMLVTPAFVEEDEIKTLYVSFNLQELAPVEDQESDPADATSDQMVTDGDGSGGNDDDDDDEADDDDGDDGDDDDDDDDDGESDTDNGGDENNSPPRKFITSSRFTTDVNLNPDGGSTTIYYRLTLGSLLIKIREHLLKQVYIAQNIDPDNATYPADLGVEEIMQLDKERLAQRKEYDNGTVIIEQLQFVRCRETQALSITFNGMVLTDEALQPLKASGNDADGITSQT